MAHAEQPKVVVVGGGIGGCTAALALHRAGADVFVYEQASELKEIGAGINVQAVAIAAIADLGVSVELLSDPEHGDGIQTSKIQYYTPDGIFIAEELAGLAAGASHPQFSLHRAKFHTTLVEECRRCLGEDHVFLDSSFASLEQTDDGVIAHFKRRSGEALPPVHCDLLVGCDGLKSRVRAALLGDAVPRYTGRTIFRGVCEMDDVINDGTTVSLCGNYNRPGNFICYPISEGRRREGKTLCNWGFVAHRECAADKGESWVGKSSVEDIRAELEMFGGNTFGGLTPLQMAERTESIIGWALFDRDPLDTFDYGRVTLLGDSAHPLLPFGSQGATQAVMDAEAIGVAFMRAMSSGGGVREAVQEYSALRCEVSGKVVVANRGMGPTVVLEAVEEKCAGMEREEKERWIKEHGKSEMVERMKAYRASMPQSVRTRLAGAGEK